MTRYLLVAGLVAVSVAVLMAASLAFQPHPATDEATAQSIALAAQTAALVAQRDADTRATALSILAPLLGYTLLAAGVGLPAALILRVSLLYRHDMATLDTLHHLALNQPGLTLTLQTGRHHITIDTVPALPPGPTI